MAPNPPAARVATLMACLMSTSVVACTGTAPPPPAPPPSTSVAKPVASSKPDPPAYLAKFPGLWVRSGEDVVEAPPEDVALAKTYPRSDDKGPVVDGHRLTLLVKKTKLKIGEEVRVLHVHEVTVEGEMLFPMGPKAVRGEHLDGKLVSPTVLGDPNPFVPDVYDGPTMQSPGADYSWEITRYKFTAAGVHTVQWRLGKYQSNVITLQVSP